MGGFKNLSGKTIGIWKVIEFDHMKWYGITRDHGMSYYKCECVLCGAICLKSRSNLSQGKNKYHYGCGVKQNAKSI